MTDKVLAPVAIFRGASGSNSRAAGFGTLKGPGARVFGPCLLAFVGLKLLGGFSASAVAGSFAGLSEAVSPGEPSVTWRSASYP